MQKVFLFDFFGVLCDDPHLIWLRDNDLTTRTPELIDKYYRYTDIGTMSSKELYTHLAEVSGKPAIQVESEVKRNLRIDSEVKEIIRALKVNSKVGLCSNAQPEFVESIINENGLTSLFDAIIISSQVGLRKPNKEMFMYALSKLEANASQTIFIDDNKSYVQEAEELGISSIVFTSAQQLRKDLFSKGINA